jgi:hypothetical protein
MTGERRPPFATLLCQRHSTGIDFHVEGPVGRFALGRGTASEASD